MTVDINRIKELAGAASSGPWRWELNHQNKGVSLVGGSPQFDKTVMGFERWGMSGAAPCFNDAVAGREYNIMERAERYGVKVAGREHHANWFMDVEHPDAQWIVAANPAAMLELAGQYERLQEQAEVLHKVANALGLPPGTDVTRHVLPAVLALMGIKEK